MGGPSPTWAAEHAEADARKRFRHEREMNHVIERRNPGLQPTEAYQRTPIPSSSPIFDTAASYWRYRWLRELAKYDPHVRLSPSVR